MAEQTLKHTNWNYRIKIKVIGVGGGSINAIDHIIKEGLSDIDVDFIAAGTDKQALEHSSASNKIQLGINVANGEGVNLDSCKGREAALENFEEIKEILRGAHLVLIVACLGGGTGTGAAPIIAQAAKEIGALTIGITTFPFRFEGSKRTKLANQGLEELKGECNSVVVIPSERLFEVTDKNLGIKESFKHIDDILLQAIGSISNVILSQGKNDLNIDFFDIKIVMNNRGLAFMSAGYATGAKAACGAIKAAIESPLLNDISIDDAMGILVVFEIHPGYPMLEIAEAMDIVEENSNDDSFVMFGTTTSLDMDIDEVKITIIATGFKTMKICLCTRTTY